MAADRAPVIGPYGHWRRYMKTGNVPRPCLVTWAVLQVAITKNVPVYAHYCERCLLERLTISNFNEYLRKALHKCVSWEMRVTLIIFYYQNKQWIHLLEDIPTIFYRLQSLLALYEVQDRERHALFHEPYPDMKRAAYRNNPPRPH